LRRKNAIICKVFRGEGDGRRVSHYQRERDRGINIQAFCKKKGNGSITHIRQKVFLQVYTTILPKE